MWINVKPFLGHFIVSIVGWILIRIQVLGKFLRTFYFDVLQQPLLFYNTIQTFTM